MAVEFRSGLDDAWYDVLITNDGCDRLRVKFVGFADDHDEVYEVNELSSFNDIDEFSRRFRPLSVQVQDTECSQVVKGMLVCASHSIRHGDRRFYDAVVKKVVHEEHQFVKGEEECSCSLILFWRHGPKAGSLTAQSLDTICRVQPRTNKMHPLLNSFLKTAREKIETTLSNISAIPRDIAYDTKTCMSNYRHKLSGVGHDTDVEEVPYIMAIENLEKGLSPLKIVEFIHQQLSISCQAFVSPSLSSEWYTRGTILLDSRKNVDKLSDFLESTDHIIISASGRPWVMTEKRRAHERLRGSIVNSMLISQKLLERRTSTCNELKVASSGTEEYMRAKLLQDLFCEYSNQQRRLHQKLLKMEFWCGGHVALSLVLVGFLVLCQLEGSLGLRFVIDREECFSHDAKYMGDTIHVSFVVIKVDSTWHYTEDGVDLVIKGPGGEQIHDIRGKTSEKYELVVQNQGVHQFCFTNKSPYHETIDFDVHAAHFTYHDQHAKDEHFTPLLEQIQKLEEALYNIQFEQHWLEAETDRQAIVNEGMSRRATHKALIESAALIGASCLQVFLLKQIIFRRDARMIDSSDLENQCRSKQCAVGDSH
ncbi:unnamed protein product [Malus baccata var. baccata]